jgi:arginine exporter protein ArgO
MSSAFWAGVLAGYGIAVPVGAIAILIVEVGLQRGFVPAFAAGAGAATADLIYAAVAALAGVALAALLMPAAGALRVASGLVLIGLGLYGLYRLWRGPAGQPRPNSNPASALGLATASGSNSPPPAAPWRTYAQFVGLTLLNPATVAYFAALILGMRGGESVGAASRLAFVAGAALASLSWQSLLAGIASLGHQRLSPRFRALTSATGNLIILAFGVRALLGL